MKVPTIWSASNATAIRIVLLNRNATPIATSHQPIIETHVSPSKNGNQGTVARTSGSAEEMPSGFRMPNQTKIIPKEIRTAIVPHRAMNADIRRSISSRDISTSSQTLIAYLTRRLRILLEAQRSANILQALVGRALALTFLIPCSQRLGELLLHAPHL